MELQPIIQVRNLTKEFPVKQSLRERTHKDAHKVLSALHDVSLDIYKGEVLSIVGESGCGKSTFARVLTLLHENFEGSVMFDGVDISQANKKWIQDEYRTRIQMVFQDPYSCLNPRKTAGAALREVLDVHHVGQPAERDQIIDDLLAQCGIPAALKQKYPHELSGGQLQRIGIARALMVSPDVLIADEPVSALDVSVQAQIINLLQDLRQELGLTLIFISHDLSIVRLLSDRVAVMYLGELVELGTVNQVFDSPLHPYTKLLLASAPKIVLDASEETSMQADELPNAIDVPDGCRFQTRCPLVGDVCRTAQPTLKQMPDGHQVACVQKAV